ncbi:hypothetical protein [Aureispira sp. CCB-QB1]|uniref:hypothetical protein n=1 Tax=Aureispira sp. CCB-QB1 TaxID=1313421 RepID=UPI0006974BE7|nr:hypothetical protein [Aureispira sp. CCB-QB1]
MSILDQLNPKAQFKKLFFKRLPQIREDLSMMLDALFLEMADKHQCNPFEMTLLLLKMKQQAVGKFFDGNKNEIGAFDAGALIQELFIKQLATMPEMIKGYVLDELGTEDTTKMVLKALKSRRLLIHYGEDDEFVFVEVTKKGNKVIDLDDFFNTFDF